MQAIGLSMRAKGLEELRQLTVIISVECSNNLNNFVVQKCFALVLAFPHDL